MKVMLILPPSNFAIKETLGTTGMPLGLAYLASTLEKENHEVKIIDAPTLNWRITTGSASDTKIGASGGMERGTGEEPWASPMTFGARASSAGDL